MQIHIKWDKEAEPTGKMYLPLVDGKAGKPVNDLEKAKTEAMFMATSLLHKNKKRKEVTIVVLIYETALMGTERNIDDE